jgi:hypothetical protein
MLGLKDLFDRDALEFSFFLGFLSLDGFMMGKVLNVLWVVICFVSLGLGCVVELFWWSMFW